MRVCQDQSKESLERIRQQFLDAKTELERWERSTYQEAIQRFGDAFADVRQEWLAKLQEELDPGGQLVTNAIGCLRQSPATPEELVGAASQIQQDWLAKTAEQAGRLQHEFNERVLALVSETCRTLIANREAITPKQVQGQRQGPPGTEVEDLNVRFSGFEEARNALYGGMAGSAIGGIAVTLLSVLFPPVAAISLVAAIAGGIIGSGLAAEDLAARRREEVLMKLQAILQNLARRCQRQAVNQFTEIANGYERYARDSFRQAAEQARNTLQERLKQVEAAGTHSRDENRARSDALRARIQQVESVRHSLDEIIAESPQATS